MKKAMATVETMREQNQGRQLLSQRSQDEVDGDMEVGVGLSYSLDFQVKFKVKYVDCLSIYSCDWQCNI